MAIPTREQAIAELESGHAAIRQLCARLSAEQMLRPASIGAGEWSAKDLLSHLAFWEQLAAEAVADWRAGVRPSAEDLFAQEPTDAANAANQARTASQSLDEVVEWTQVAHSTIVETIRVMSDVEWAASPAYADARAGTLGELLGRVLAAPTGPFQHASTHLEDLRAYVDSQHRLEEQ